MSPGVYQSTDGRYLLTRPDPRPRHVEWSLFVVAGQRWYEQDTFKTKRAAQKSVASQVDQS